MSPAAADPYKVLGVSPEVSDEELRVAYRHLVQLHHPDHNQGSADSARRFEEIQQAYADVTKLRKAGAGDHLTARIAELEHELREAQRAREQQLRDAQHAREQALRDAREAAAERDPKTARSRTERPSDEELGYVRTDDSFSKILADARAELADRISEALERRRRGH